jgi:charged multivesicular body protein 6
MTHNKHVPFNFLFSRARTLLRKKKYQEKLLQNADGQLETLEKMASDIEFAQVELQVLDGLKNGNVALKKVHDILSIDEVEQIMDETREAIEKQQEIDEILTGALTADDEDAVMAELEELVENEQREALAKLDVAGDEDIDEQLPDVPDEDLPEKSKKVEGRFSNQNQNNLCYI